MGVLLVTVFGNFELNDSKLKFSPMGATRMACPDLAKETEFFQMLDKVDSFNLKDNMLSFYPKRRLSLHFKNRQKINLNFFSSSLISRGIEGISCILPILFRGGFFYVFSCNIMTPLSASW